MTDTTPRLRILIADDEPQLLRAYARTLSGRGYDVTTADDGAACLARTRNEEFDAILTDVCMPGFGGLELLRSVHARNPDIPVVLMTAVPSVEVATAAIEYGVQRFLAKPVSSDRLVETMAQAVAAGQAAAERRRAAEREAKAQVERARLEQAFESALSSLYLVVQPIVMLAEGRAFGYEALLRTTEPVFPHPGVFLDAAERLGRLPDIGRAVRVAAAALIPSLPQGAKMFVNLHPLDLADPEILSADAPLSAHASRVVLEITERASLDAVPNAVARLAALRALGYQIAVDDLGAGYAGLSSFATFEPQVAKIDMALTRGIDRAPVKQKLVKMIMTLCADLDIAVVAEGVETIDERDMLASLGVQLFQGYFFGRPAKQVVTSNW